MQMAVAISYFHRKIGPIVWHSYPEEALTDEEKPKPKKRSIIPMAIIVFFIIYHILNIFIQCI